MGTVTTGVMTSARIEGRVYEGVAVDVGNPHLVSVVPTLGGVTDADLTGTVEADTAVFPHGVNVEVVHVISPDHAVMRVLERGVGETQACGTGAVAVARVVGGTGPATTRVDLPGGTVEVRFALDGTATLTGPAVIVARGDVTIPDDLVAR
jgi:diaminopimelate epimerase